MYILQKKFKKCKIYQNVVQNKQVKVFKCEVLIPLHKTYIFREIFYDSRSWSLQHSV